MHCNTLQSPLFLVSSTHFNAAGHVISSSPAAFQRPFAALAAGQLPASACLQHPGWWTAPASRGRVSRETRVSHACVQALPSCFRPEKAVWLFRLKRRRVIPFFF